MFPKVSIITLNWNGLEDTIECLESLKKITYPNCEVYAILIQNDRNYGFVKGCNIGMKKALDNGADYVLLLNNDTVVQRDPKIGIAGGITNRGDAQ
jgi:hypothetical protein